MKPGLWGWCGSLQLPPSLLLPEPEGRPQETSPQGGNAAGPCVSLGWQPEPDLSHPAHNLPFQESCSSQELGMCSVLDVLAWPACGLVLPQGLDFCPPWLSPPLKGACWRCVWVVKATSGVSGMWNKIRDKAPETQKTQIWKETRSQPLCILPRDGGCGTRAHETSASPVPVPCGGIPRVSLHSGHRQGL